MQLPTIIGLLAATALPIALADVHSNCWCVAVGGTVSSIEATRAACAAYPRDRVFDYVSGKLLPNPTSIKIEMNNKTLQCTSYLRKRPDHVNLQDSLGCFMGGKEFSKGCHNVSPDASSMKSKCEDHFENYF